MVDSPKDTLKPAVTIDAEAKDVTGNKATDKNAGDKTGPVKPSAKKDDIQQVSKSESTAKAAPAENTSEKPVKQSKTSVPKSNPEAVVKKVIKNPTEFGRNSKKPTSKPSEATPAAPNKASGFFGRLVASIMGGIIVLGGVGTAQYLGYIPSAADYNPNQPNSSSAAVPAINIEAFEKRLAALQSSLDEGGTLDEAVLNAAIDARLATQVPNTGADNSELAEKLSMLETKLAETATAITAIKQAPAAIADPQALSGMNSKLSKIDEQVFDLSTGLTAQSEALAALKSQYDNDKHNGADKKAARALAAAALKSDIDAGQPFSGSLQTLAAVSDDASILEDLKPYAEKGVSTLGQLAAQFKLLGNSLVTAAAPAQNKGAFSRLIAGAKSLVTVKQIGPIDGDSVGAIVSRISAALTSGNGLDASKLWASLPDAAKETSRNWNQDLSARLTADSLVAKTVKSFMLSGS